VNRLHQSIQRSIKSNANETFLNLSYIDLLVCAKELSNTDKNLIYGSKLETLIQIMKQKIKFLFQFNFLKSNFFENWIQNPLNLVKINFII